MPTKRPPSGAALPGSTKSTGPSSLVAKTCPDEFADLYRQHVCDIYRYHHARTGSSSDAQDLTAETFRAAFENYARFRSSKGTPAAWLMGIARHKLADHFRKDHKEVPLESIESVISEGGLPEVQFGQTLQLNQVARALRRLNPARAEALVLHLYAGLCLEETGKILGKSPQAVKKLVLRGLADLRHTLRKEEMEP